MSDIAELEGRIATALGRIGQAVEAFSPGEAVSSGELEEARTAAQEANARAEAAEADADRSRQALEAEVETGTQLHEHIASLNMMKERQQERIAELEAEVRMLVEQRGADRAELDELIAALEPLIREQTDA